MKEWLLFLGYIVFAVVVIAIGIFSALLFYFAPWPTVKDYWLISHTPARCIQ